MSGPPGPSIVAAFVFSQLGLVVLQYTLTGSAGPTPPAPPAPPVALPSGPEAAPVLAPEASWGRVSLALGGLLCLLAGVGASVLGTVCGLCWCGISGATLFELARRLFGGRAQQESESPLVGLIQPYGNAGRRGSPPRALEDWREEMEALRGGVVCNGSAACRSDAGETPEAHGFQRSEHRQDAAVGR